MSHRSTDAAAEREVLSLCREGPNAVERAAILPEVVALSELLGSQRFGTSYRFRNPETGLLDGEVLPVDLAANAASLGADVLRVKTVEEFGDALRRSRASDRTTVVSIETDPLAPVPDSEGWWDVPVSEVAVLESTQKARAAYEAAKRGQRIYL